MTDAHSTQNNTHEERALTMVETSTRKVSKPRAKRPPKYCDPSNPERTWNGIGFKPKWFTQALKSGITAESMEIAKSPEQAAPTEKNTPTALTLPLEMDEQENLSEEERTENTDSEKTSSSAQPKQDGVAVAVEPMWNGMERALGDMVAQMVETSKPLMHSIKRFRFW
ncbi:MAG: H-NS histone family protein [Magnetococcales bacterium]|nr:H-NS histone family protein [Magnetococcales bacterium]